MAMLRATLAAAVLAAVHAAPAAPGQPRPGGLPEAQFAALEASGALPEPGPGESLQLLQVGFRHQQARMNTDNHTQKASANSTPSAFLDLAATAPEEPAKVAPGPATSLTGAAAPPAATTEPANVAPRPAASLTGAAAPPAAAAEPAKAAPGPATRLTGAAAPPAATAEPAKADLRPVPHVIRSPPASLAAQPVTNESAGNMIPGPPVGFNKKSKVVWGLLELFGLGMLGIDRFYLGNNVGLAVGKLLVSVFTMGIGGFVWTLIDIINFLVNAFQMKDRINNLGQKSYFGDGEVTGARTIAIIQLIFLALTSVLLSCGRIPLPARLQRMFRSKDSISY